MTPVFHSFSVSVLSGIQEWVFILFERGYAETRKDHQLLFLAKKKKKKSYHFSHGDSNYMFVRLVYIVSQVLDRSFWVFFPLPFCFLLVFQFGIFYYLSSNSLILSSAVLSLLMSPQKTFFISVNGVLLLTFLFDFLIVFISTLTFSICSCMLSLPCCLPFPF